jgi:hypothetical protein
MTVTATLAKFRDMVNRHHTFGRGAPRWTVNDERCYGVILAHDELPALLDAARLLKVKVVFVSLPFRTQVGTRIQVNVRDNGQ